MNRLDSGFLEIPARITSVSPLDWPGHLHKSNIGYENVILTIVISYNIFYAFDLEICSLYNHLISNFFDKKSYGMLSSYGMLYFFPFYHYPFTHCFMCL